MENEYLGVTISVFPGLICVYMTKLMVAVRPLYVEKDEGVGSIVSRVENVGDENLALVFPQNSEVFSDVVELKFLKKQIERTDKKIVLITQGDAQADLAKSLGFKVKKDLEADFEDEFLESFYQDTEKEKKDQQKESEIEKKKTSVKEQKEQKKERELKKKRLQVSDIVKPQKERKKRSKATSQKSKEAQSKKAPRQEKRNSSIEEVYKKEDKDDTGEPQSVGHGSSILGFLSWFSLPKLIGILFLGSLIALGLTITYVFPEAKVGIEPREETQKTAFSLTIDKSIDSSDLDKKLIPAEVFKKNKKIQKAFQSSGKEEVENKARGTVKIYNGYTSQPQTLVRTTRLISESDKMFRLVNTIEVPGADIVNSKIEPNYIEAEVVADEPGSEYNIKPSEFTIPGFKDSPGKYEGFYAISEEPMEGGKVGTIQKVTEKDKEEALSSLKDSLVSEIKTELQESIPEDLKIIEESFKLDLQGVQLNPGVGEAGKEFQIQATGTAQTFALREDYVKRIIKKNLEEEMKEDQEITKDSFEITYKDPALNFEKGTATLKVEASANLTWKIKKEKLKQDLKGKDEVGARKAVADYPEIKSLQVELWPFWLRRIPNKKDKITIKVQG